MHLQTSNCVVGRGDKSDKHSLEIGRGAGIATIIHINVYNNTQSIIHSIFTDKIRSE